MPRTSNEGSILLPEKSVNTAPPIPTATPVGVGIRRIIGFFAFCALLAYVLHGVINFGLRRITTSKFGTFNKLVSGQINTDVLINGSSRALTHYDPRIIGEAVKLSAYNIGMNASQIDYQLAMLKLYLKHNRKPKILIQNLDLFSFEVTKKGAIYDPGYYIPYLGEKEIYEFLRTIDPNVWKWKYIPLYGYSVEDMRFTWVFGLLGCFGISGREDYYAGFNPRHQKWNDDFQRFKNTKENGFRYEISREGVKCLAEILQLCRDNAIRTFLVYSPEYREIQPLELNRTEIMTEFKQIADRFSVQLWDYSDSPICSNSALFYNSQHLNADGAATFSRDIAARLAAVLSKTPESTGLSPSPR